MNAQLAMYKGPATGRKNVLGHRAVCVLTWSPYSHVELVIDGVCYSSSFRDGGVRAKTIPDLKTSGHFDLYDIDIDVTTALARFADDKGKPYDWPGMLRVCWALRWLPRTSDARFCSEEVAYMLGLRDPETYSPHRLLETVVGIF